MPMSPIEPQAGLCNSRRNFGRVLDHFQTVLARHRQNAIHIGRIACRCTTMIALVFRVILLSISAGSILNVSSISAKTGSAPASTIALKHECQSTPVDHFIARPYSKCIHRDDERSRSRRNSQREFRLHTRGEFFSKVSTFIGGSLPGPYHRKGRLESTTSINSFFSFRAVKLRAPVIRAQRRLPDGFTASIASFAAAFARTQREHRQPRLPL